MIQKICLLLILVFLLGVSPSHIHAAKKRIRTPAKVAPKTGQPLSYSQAKLSRNTNSVTLTFLNLGNVSRVQYILNYTGNGVSQGAGGSVTSTGQASDSRDLYFGTCSHGVCTPHRNIKDAQIIVTTTLKNGVTHTKRYRLKV